MVSVGHKPFLPFEILVNILKRLPVKSIVKFQCVCKDWKNLFKTPFFIAEHARHSAHEDPLLLLHEKGYKSIRLLNHKMETVEVMSIPSIDCLRRWRIIGSCNGLLCVEVDLDRGKSTRLLCIWNPSIREFREISQTTTNDDAVSDNFVFGFSSIINDFKIVKFYNQDLPKRKRKKNAGLVENHEVKVYSLRAEVYSLNTGSWKELEFQSLKNTIIISKALSVDGTIIWLGVHDSFYVVVSFDIATEVFTLTPIPSLGRHVFVTTLGMYQNKLAMFQSRGETSSNSINIWVMGEAGSESGKSFSCIEEYNVGINSYFFHPSHIWRNEIVCRDKDVEDEEVEGEPKYFIKLFNLTTKKWKEFHNSSWVYGCHAPCNYERSLVSVWNTQVE